MINQTKDKLRRGETVYGAFLRYCEPGLVEVLGQTGWDFLVLDAEHGTMQPRECENLVRATELGGVTPIVRVTTNEQPVILRYLDTGAMGLHVPWVNTAEDAQAAVQSAKFQPQGRRGVAGSRAASYGYDISWPDYIKQFNDQSLVVLQAESTEAVDNLDRILEVDGVDVIFIGPMDLSNSLGIPGRFDDPKFKDTVQRIADIVLKSDVALGIMVANADGAAQWKQRGARYITIPFEVVLRQGCRNYLDQV